MNILTTRLFKAHKSAQNKVKIQIKLQRIAAHAPYLK